ncbi:MAG: sulfatase-like hydrolase/transferase [Rikenellaceae bacterium]
MKSPLKTIIAIFLSSIILSAIGRLLFVAVQWSSTMQLDTITFLKIFYRGLYLDISVAGYITALPLICIILSLWLINGAIWRVAMRIYLSVIALLVAIITGVDANLYRYWGYRVDGTLIPFLTSPTEAAASIGLVDLFIGFGVAIVVGTAGIYLFWRSVRGFVAPRLGLMHRVYATLFLLLCGGFIFIGIRGGFSRAVANVSKVYFSDIQYANHAAVNPAFSLLSSMLKVEDFGRMYSYYDEHKLSEIMDDYRCQGDGESSLSILKSDRPNILIIIAESYTRTIMDMEVDGRAVMPSLNALASEGILFDNIYANGARTDRGVAAVLSGFPTQPKHSVMKIPAKSRHLPSIASSLGNEGYRSNFYYGGDLNFMDMSSYLYATGWQRLVATRDISSDEAIRSWGYSDGVVGELVADEFISLASGGEPLLMGWLTLSFHEPFDVPKDLGFEDVRINAAAYSDAMVGETIERLRSSAVWDNALVIIVADHTYAYPTGIDVRSPLRYRIPMVWCGGALRDDVRGVVEERFLSQIDIPATLLSQMGIDSSGFEFSRNIYSPNYNGLGYYTFSEGFGIVDSSGATIEDLTAQRLFSSESKSDQLNGETLIDTTQLTLGRVLLQRTHRAIDEL